MKSDLSYWLFGIMGILIIAMVGGYWYSYSLHSKVTEVWKQTLWDDCTNRMREINVKKKQIFTSETSPDIKIETEDQTLHLKENATESLTTKEKDFLAYQYYLSLKNPVKIEKLDSLFRLKLKENGFTFKTAVSLYNNKTEKKTFYGEKDVKVLHDYLKLTYKVDIRDVILLEGYVKGGWFENLLWGKSYYYVILFIIACLALIILVVKKKNSKRPNSLIQPVLPDTRNERHLDITQVLPDELVWKEVELVTEPVKEQEESLSKPTANVIYLDEEKHVLIYSEMAIFLAPKVFGLFNQLSKGKDYFQPYEYLYQTLWTEKNNVDKKHLEQLVIRLRKDLKDIQDLSIDAIRGSGYQLKWKNDMKLTIEQIEYNNE